MSSKCVSFSDSHQIYVEVISRIEEDVLYRSDSKPYSTITIGGQRQDFQQHGHHFIVLDARTGAKKSQMSFDTHQDPTSGHQMAGFLAGIPDKMIILMVVYYQAHDYFNASSSTLSFICPEGPATYSNRQSWSMICLKGYGVMPWVKSNVSTGREGPAIAKSHILLPKELKTAPVINKVVDMGPRSLELNWSAPLTDSFTGELLAFQICYEKSHLAAGNCSVTSVSGGSTKAVVSGLQPFQDYVLKIRGVVALGYGPFSDVVSHKTPEAEPATGPTGISFPSVNFSSILLTWTLPAVQDRHGIIQQYSICYQKEHEVQPCNNTRNFSVYHQSFLASGLRPYTRYRFQLKAATSVGFGPATIVYHRTSSTEPDGAPLDPRSSRINSTSILLSWLPPTPELRNGIIVNYKICIRIFSESPGPCMWHVWLGNQTQYTVTNLEPYTTYNFKISAATSVGTGPSVLLVNRTAQAEPSAPPIGLSIVSVGQHNITVTWFAPVSSDVNGILTKYSVCMRKESDPSCQQQDTVPVSQTFYAFDGLAPFVNYTIAVRAATVAGSGPEALVTRRTSPSVPSGPPTGIIVTFLNESMIQFTWSPPEIKLRNGVIIYYKLCIREYGSLHTCNDTKTVPGTRQDFAFGDLDPIKEYSMDIKAGTVVGFGPPAFVQKTAGRCDLPVLHRGGLVTDSSFSASGYIGNEYEPHQGRLNNELPWCDTGKRGNAYLQVDFQGPLRILGVATQGHRKHWDSWVSSYNILCSTNGLDWTYRTVGGKQVIQGNTGDGDTVVQHFLDEPIVARYVRFKVVSFVGLHQCMRVEILGCAPASGIEMASVNFVNSSSMIISWTPLSKDTKNGRTYGYNLCYKESASQMPCMNSALVRHGTSSFSISNLKAYTKYTVKISAGTIAGYGPSVILEARTNESAPTGPPFAIMTQDVTATSLGLVWSAPEKHHRSGIITKYGVCYQDSQLRTNCRNITEVNEDQRVYRITDLRPNTEYMLQVRAATAVDWGPPGAVYQTTLSSAPSAPPQSVSVTRLGATVLQISWFPPPPETRNGHITGYRVCYIEEADTGQCKNYVSLPDTQATYSISGLKPDTAYEMHVEAKTSVGYGPPRVVIHKTGESVPSAPPQNVVVNSVNATSIEITWQPPEEEKRNGVITSYELVVFREISGSEIEKLSTSLIPSSVNSWSNSELSSNTDYIFYLRAGTAKGFGPSVIIHKKTEAVTISYAEKSSEGKLTSGGIAGGSVMLFMLVAGCILSILWNKGLLPNTKVKRLKEQAQKRHRRRRRRRRTRRRRRRRRRRKKEMRELEVHVSDPDHANAPAVQTTESVSELGDYDAPTTTKRRDTQVSVKLVTAEDLYDTLGAPGTEMYRTASCVPGLERQGTTEGDPDKLGPPGRDMYRTASCVSGLELLGTTPGDPGMLGAPGRDMYRTISCVPGLEIHATTTNDSGTLGAPGRDKYRTASCVPGLEIHSTSTNDPGSLGDPGRDMYRAASCAPGLDIYGVTTGDPGALDAPGRDIYRTASCVSGLEILGSTTDDPGRDIYRTPSVIPEHQIYNTAPDHGEEDIYGNARRYLAQDTPATLERALRNSIRPDIDITHSIMSAILPPVIPQPAEHPVEIPEIAVLAPTTFGSAVRPSAASHTNFREARPKSPIKSQRSMSHQASFTRPSSSHSGELFQPDVLFPLRTSSFSTISRSHLPEPVAHQPSIPLPTVSKKQSKLFAESKLKTKDKE